MVTWKNSIALAVVAAGVLVNCATPATTMGQSSEFSNAPADTGTFIQDFQPFSKSYGPQAELITSLPAIETPIINQVFAPVPANKVTDLLAAASAFEQSNSASAPIIKKPANSKTQARSQRMMPTVIVRPPVNSTISLNDLTVDVEKVVTQSGDDYTLKLMIPKSVRFIEVTPVDDANLDRNFKIRVTQSDVRQPIVEQEPIRSKFSMPIAAPVHSASALNAVQPERPSRSAIQAEPQAQQNEQPVPNRNGFKRNPFYQSLKNGLDSNTAAIQNDVYSNVVKADSIPTAKTETNSQQASYRMSESPPANEQAADAAQSTAEIETGEKVVSEMYGPNVIGLGDIGDFVIYVANITEKPTQQVEISLHLPTGLDVVVLDREASIDVDAGTLSWSFDELLPGQDHFIRYRVKSLKEGVQRQVLSVNLNESTRMECEFETDVILDCENSSAPFLPYESE